VTFPRIGGWTLALGLGLGGGFAVGIGLGWLSWSVWVIGMHALVAGVVVGALVGFGLALTGGPWGRAARVVAALGVLAGWVAEQAIEDRHLLAAHRADVAIAAQATTGLTAEQRERAFGGEGESDARVLAGRGADRKLEEEVALAVGIGGPVGRWIFRAGEGVRLAGSWRQSRGLPVGVVGAVVWALAENALGLYLAHRVLKRIERRVVAPGVPSAG
jgi:hypothetical protein